MQYNNFADVYDDVIGQNYTEWHGFIQELFGIYCASRPETVIDLGCGTGNLTLLLAKAGHVVTGVDISERMLDVARRKITKKSRDAVFVRHDMVHYHPDAKADAYICTMDSLNYLRDIEVLERMFVNVSQYLKCGGVFVCDIATKKAFLQKTGAAYVIDNGDVFYTLQCVISKKKQTCRQYATFFVKQQSGEYQRFDELHVQKILLIQHIIRAAKVAKMKIVGIHGGFDAKHNLTDCSAPSIDTLYDRITFVIKHKEQEP